MRASRATYSRTPGNQGAIRRTQRLPLRERWATPLRWLGRGLGTLVVLAMLSALGWGCHLLYKKLDKPVAVIAVESRFEHLRRSDVERLVAGAIDGGIISLDLDGIRGALEQHPWVESASVRRQWPEGLQVNIVEETPIARWGDKGFLNQRGEPLQVDDASGLQNLPLLAGPKGTARQVMKQYRDVSQLLQPVGLQVVEFRYDHRSAWWIRLQDGLVMQVGRDQIMEKMHRFISVWQQGLNEKAGQLAQVDVRYGNGIAVQWKPEQAKES